MKSTFTHRVIYQDTDAEGVVYYANYLGLFERGRTEYIRNLGISVKEIKEKKQIVFAVVKADCQYHSPAFYDDVLTVTTEVEELTAATIVFQQTAARGEKLLVSARISLCALNCQNFRPVRLPQELNRK